MPAYDPGACGIKISLMNPAGTVGTPNLSFFDYWGSEEQHRPGYKDNSGNYTYWKQIIYKIRTQHRLEALMNPDALKYSKIDDAASEGNNAKIKNFMYNSDGKTRRRFIVTLLEHYTDDKEYPRLLVRVRLLKNLSDVAKDSQAEAAIHEEDPFLIGPKFYLSEPAWYGGFVGQRPKQSEDKKTFSFRSLFYGGDDNVNSALFKRLNNQNVYELKGQNGRVSMQEQTCTYHDDPIYYAVKSTENEVSENNNKLYSNFGGVFKRAELNTRLALETHGDNQDHANSARYFSLGDTGPARMRWFGLSVWPDIWQNAVSVTVHDITLGPGFNKDELLAIVENGAKLFGMDEACNKNFSLANCEYKAERDGGSSWTRAIFGSLKGQDETARGKSKYNVRFTGADDGQQTCVMSLQHTKDNDGCPICDAYNKYKSDSTERISDWGY